MKNNIIRETKSAGTGNITALWGRYGERDDYPSKACVVFDNGASARSARRLIRRVSRNEAPEVTLLRFDECLPSSNRDDRARSASDSELLVVAMGHGGELPDFAKSWLELWASFCRDDCALVAFITNGSSRPDSDCPLLAFLEAIAVANNFEFFYGCVQDLAEPALPSVIGWKPSQGATRAVVGNFVLARANLQTVRWGINE
jgi:hypothetical protein